MAVFKGSFYLDNGSYIEISISEHRQRLDKDSEYAARRFIATGGYLLEVPELEYQQLLREANRQRYLDRSRPLVSIYQHSAEGNQLLDELGDPDVDVQREAEKHILTESIHAALQVLSIEELAAYKALFMDRLSISEYARQLGISRRTVSRRRENLFAKLRCYLGLLE